MKKIFLFTVLLSVICTLFACAGEKVIYDDVVTLIDDGKSEYRLVIDDRADDSVVDAGISIVHAAKSIGGAKIDMVLDEQTKVHREGREILLGGTDRSVPAELYPEKAQDYVIAVHENRVIILGGSDEATVGAAEYFAENIIAEKVTLEQGYVYRYVYDYPEIVINGSKATGFDITAPEFFDPSEVKTALLETCGLSEGTTPLIIEIDPHVSLKTVRFSERDGGLVISASSEYGLNMCDDIISNELALIDRLVFIEGTELEFTYEMPELTELMETHECYVLCTTDKSPLEYEVGEEMVFTLNLYCDGEEVNAPGFFYTVEKDYTDEIVRERVYGENGSVEIRTSMDTPGFVKIYAAVISENGAEFKGVMPFNGGAAAGFSEILPSALEPDDFDEFWEGQLAELDNIVPDATIVNDLSEDYPGYRVYDLHIDSVGSPVTGYLSIPENAEPGTLPVLVGFMDYGVFSPEPSVKEDTIVLVVNAHGIENGMDDEYYETISGAALYSYGFSRFDNEKRETVYFKNMILRNLQALRYLKTLEEWDGVNIELNGGGQGAYQAIAAAAFDKDVSYVYAAYPWLCDINGPNIGRIEGWYPDYSDALAYFDTINFAKRAECELEIVAGLGDYTCAPSGVAALANSLSPETNIEFYQGVTHKYIPPVTEPYRYNFVQE